MADSITYTDNGTGQTAEVNTSQKVTASWTGTASSYTLKYATGGSSVYTQVYQGADTSASFLLADKCDISVVAFDWRRRDT